MTWIPFSAPAPGGDLQGWQRGDGERLVVVLHGGPGLTDYTEALGDEVAAGGGDDVLVVRYQQRGQAPSVPDGPFSVERFVDDVLAVIDAADATSAVLVGHSWGGHLALLAAVAHPDRVDGLLLVDSLGAVGDGGSGTMGDVFRSRIGAAGEEALAALAASGRTGDDAAAEELRILWPGYFADPGAAPPMPPIGVSTAVNEGLMGEVMARLGDGALERALPALAMPSVHLIGRHSPIDPSANEATAALLAGAVVRIEDTGHFPWLERPGSVTEAMRDLRGRLTPA